MLLILYTVVSVLTTGAMLALMARQAGFVRRHRGVVPGAFAADVSLAEHQTAADYERARLGVRAVGAVVDHLGQPVQQQLEPQREGVRGQQIDRRVEDVRRTARRIDIDDADAGALRTRVDAEDPDDWGMLTDDRLTRTRRRRVRRCCRPFCTSSRSSSHASSLTTACAVSPSTAMSLSAR